MQQHEEEKEQYYL